MTTPVKPKVQNLGRRIWVVHCLCSWKFIQWTTDDGLITFLASTQPEAFARALDHARSKHWTPEVAP